MKDEEIKDARILSLIGSYECRVGVRGFNVLYPIFVPFSASIAHFVFEAHGVGRFR